ncbi:MAG: hypothetical protein ABIJ20_02195 [Nanoarchaeota archaeon]|nr:hypothetical protein [Nanoarchaeota archaeon]MBU1445267.1 hypothetical protein [Nanoarchaeota archaeon]MBU2420463.1 hypothetical protein [Nanoarchaeota archaeon]MBU2475111.1 hypothetical protein [Nanoarchaeota archaeon]
MEWKLQDKMTFFFSMLFLLLVTIALFNVANTVALKGADKVEGVQLSPGQANPELLSQTRQNYLFTIISVTVLFLGLFYYAVMWPKKKK